jgi:hypothetical protein
VLVVDEVSMLDAATFDALELIAREIRDSDEPFGGIQLVGLNFPQKKTKNTHTVWWNTREIRSRSAFDVLAVGLSR